MPLVKDKDAVSAAAVEEATADAAKANAVAEEVAGEQETCAKGADVLEEATPAEEAEAARAATQTTAVTEHTGEGAMAKRQASQAAVLHDMADSGFEGLNLDYSSFPNIVLKDGEFQIAGSTRSFDAVKGFSGVVTGTRRKYAYRVGGDDDGDVIFAYDAKDFSNPELEVCKKLQEWKAEGLKPEMKEYIEAYVMVSEVFGEQEKDLVGELVVVQISPTSAGRYSGFAATQRFKHKCNPDGYNTHFLRGEKITSTKFPYYPWAFKFGGLV